MDTVTPAVRSRIMAAVRRSGTAPESAVAAALRAARLRVALNDDRLPGSPDIVVGSYRAVVFVHGCFWHRHRCRYATHPAVNREFWEKKFRDNKRRDRRVRTELRTAGWRVFTVWECLFKRPHRDAAASELAALAKAIKHHDEAFDLPRVRRLRPHPPDPHHNGPRRRPSNSH